MSKVSNPVFLAIACALGLLAGCTSVGENPKVNVAAGESTLTSHDLQWLQRVTYGIDSATIARYQQLGRQRFLDWQLNPQNAALPPIVEAQLDQMALRHTTPQLELATVTATNRAINALKDDTARINGKKALQDRGNLLVYEAKRSQLLNALYSPAQLREQMVWFWLNHFSVFQGKANVRWLAGDYMDSAIRPHALGHFRDLALAVLKHPAMLQYLDNAQSALGHVNENYARELMELHILGVGAGYSQQDVQELARILTGVGINNNDATPKLKRQWQRLYVHEGAFEFNPARHDTGTKLLLGRTFQGEGMDEVGSALDWLIQQPQCARYITKKMALYFLGTEPSAALNEKLSDAFIRSHGDIAVVLRTLLTSDEFDASLGTAFKDPVHYVVSALRYAYDGKVIVNSHPAINWINALGEPLFGRETPDGYPLESFNWTSASQLSKRFQIARAIGSSNSGLFDPEDGSPVTQTSFPQLETRRYFANIEGLLTPHTRSALEQATSQSEWNTFFLASPDFNFH